MSDDRLVHEAEVDYCYTLVELSQSCGVPVEKLLNLVGEGVLEPAGGSQREWRFDAADFARAHCAFRLERDLGVNTAGIALALQLLEDSRRLRARVRALESLLDHLS